MRRLTNRQIINKLLPIIKEAVKKYQSGAIKMDDVDYYKHPCHYDYSYIDQDVVVTYTDYGDQVVVRAYLRFRHRSRYDGAEVIARISKETNEQYVDKETGAAFGYAKEFVGMGNGYYADLDENGRIVVAEWD